MLAKRIYSNSKNGIINRSGGKGKDILSKTASGRYNKTQLSDSCDTESNNITFPYIRPSDNAELLPCYTQVLSRNQDEGIGMKDLDQLQQELEKLLSASAVRNRLLCSEFELIEVEDRSEKKGKFIDKVFFVKPPSPKHRKIEEKIKHAKDVKPPYKLVKPFHDELPKLDIPKVALPKNDTKSKFWLSVDPFCANVSRDDVAFLDELIQECEQPIDDKIPEPGQHYIEEWNTKVTADEGCSYVPPRVAKNKPATSTANGIVPKKNGFFADSYQTNVILPLASALLEENVKVNVPPEKVKEHLKPGSNQLCLDKRLRSELVELGILDPEEDPKSGSPDDEIVQEIKICNKELITLNEHNKKELLRLRNAVNKDLARQEFAQKLDEVDNKVMEVYNRLLSSSPKDRNNIEWEAVRIIQLQKDLHKEAMEIETTDYRL